MKDDQFVCTITFTPLWVKEVPPEINICRGCGENIYGAGYQLVFFIQEQMSFQPQDVFICSSCTGDSNPLVIEQSEM